MLNFPEQYEHGKSGGYHAARRFAIERLATDMFQLFRNFVPDPESQRPRRKIGILAFGTWECADSVPSPLYYLETEVTCLSRTYRIAQEVTVRDLWREGMDNGDDFLDYVSRSAPRKASDDDT